MVLSRLLFFVSLCRGGAPTPYRGQVTSGGLPVPGATVKATQGTRQFSTTTDQEGLYSFPGLTDGTWTIEVEMTGFATLKQEVEIGPNAPPGKWELKLLPLDQIKAEIRSGAEVTPGGAPVEGARHGVPLQPKGGNDEEKARESKESGNEAGNKGENNAGNTNENGDNGKAPSDELNSRADDGLLINGSVLNGAATRFAQAFAFGNYRNRGSGLYNGGLGLIFDNSALDSRPFSLSGQNTSKPAYNRLTGVATLGGPLRIPHLLERHAPNFFMAYEWTRYVDDSTQSALVPDAAERGGDFSQVLSVSVSRSKSSIRSQDCHSPAARFRPPISALRRKPYSIIIRCPASAASTNTTTRSPSTRTPIKTPCNRVSTSTLIPRTNSMADLLSRARARPLRIYSAFSIRAMCWDSPAISTGRITSAHGYF